MVNNGKTELAQMQTQMQFVSQGDVTIAANKIPVIHVESNPDARDIARAINFIRSGCPGVQFLLSNHVPQSLKGYAQQFVTVTDEYLHALEFTGEKFVLKISDSFLVITMRDEGLLK